MHKKDSEKQTRVNIVSAKRHIGILRFILAALLTITILKTTPQPTPTVDIGVGVPVAAYKAVKPLEPIEPITFTTEQHLAKIAPPTPARQAVKPAAVSAKAPVVNTAPSNCGDNSYAHFIYMKESGCRTTAVNSIGCRGIGQACPGDKLPCGADYACQNAWFTNYAIQRYGSWAAAYNFWIKNNWW